MNSSLYQTKFTWGISFYSTYNYLIYNYGFSALNICLTNFCEAVSGFFRTFAKANQGQNQFMNPVIIAGVPYPQEKPELLIIE